MDTLEQTGVNPVAYEHIAEGYADQWELMRDLFALIDYRLYLFYKYHQWLGPENDLKNMLGLVVSRAEFEHNLAKSSETGLYERVSASELEEMRLGERTVELRLGATDKRLNLMELFERFDLGEFERNCVALAYAAQLDGKYEKLFAYLQDDITKKRPTIALAVQMYLPEGGMVEGYMSLFEQQSLFTSLFDRAELAEGSLKLHPYAAEFLSRGEVTPPAGMAVFCGASEDPGGPIVIREHVNAQLRAIAASGGASAVSIIGQKGSGRRFHIRHLMAHLKQSCLFADLSAFDFEPRAVAESALIARLMGAYCCYHGLEEVSDEGEYRGVSAPLAAALTAVEQFRPMMFLVAERAVPRLSGRVMIDLALPPSDPVERLRLFSHFLSGARLAPDVSLSELASKFRLEPLFIRQAAEQAVGLCRIDGKEFVDSETIHACCYRQVVHKLDRLASRVPPGFDWDDVVLPDAQKRLMGQALAHIRHQHKVYYEWGFDKKVTYGRGLSILFAGAPGTGKTMCAQVIARQLNMQMYKINISQIVSKYIGETEKNLEAVFTEARHSNCILFFDECDAIFGKRSEVKDAHDRNANVEVAYLLQQIEEHDGVCILATNLMQNIDAAFMRRITYVVHFPFPNAALRREIYLRTLPKDAPVADDIDWDFIAGKFSLSGGHIKNIVLAAAFMAAAENRPIGMKELLTAAVNELKKNEIVVVREELREYADLIFD